MGSASLQVTQCQLRQRGVWKLLGSRYHGHMLLQSRGTCCLTLLLVLQGSPVLATYISHLTPTLPCSEKLSTTCGSSSPPSASEVALHV